MDNFTFGVAYELYEMDGELVFLSPCPMYGTMELAKAELELAYQYDSSKEWNIYKMVKLNNP